MSLQLRLPHLSGGTAEEQLRQLKSYLYQMVEQLNWALDTGLTEAAAAAYVPTASVTVSEAPSDPAAVFASIKALIIRSADIVNAYSDEITRRLDGVYTAQSEFGTYQQDTALTLEANAKGIAQNYENLQKLTGALQSYVETNAYLRSGLLEEQDDGTPVYGLEVGQRDNLNGQEVFNKFARFTANRLEFYDGGNQNTPVAYISDYKLFITNAQITGTLTLGGFELDTTDGICFRWTGGA